MRSAVQKQVKVPSCASHVPPKRHGEESQSGGKMGMGTVGGCVYTATVAVAPIDGLNGEDGESGWRTGDVLRILIKITRILFKNEKKDQLCSVLGK